MKNKILICDKDLVIGLSKMEICDNEKVQSRLEYILEKNPDIKKERIGIPPELSDYFFKAGKKGYKYKFKIAEELFKITAISGIPGTLLLTQANKFNCSNMACESIPYVIGIGLIGLGIATGLCGTSFIKKGIEEYMKFKKEKYSKPLTERERELANYVFMMNK